MRSAAGVPTLSGCVRIAVQQSQGPTGGLKGGAGAGRGWDVETREPRSRAEPREGLEQRRGKA